MNRPDERRAQRQTSFSRRNFLRGLGACIALPAFESLHPFKLMAASPAAPLATTATGAPLRSAFLFFPNGAIPGAWWPKTQGVDFEFSPTLQPLEKHKSSLQILGGLNQAAAEAGPDGAGDHARGNSVFLTGVRLKKSATDVRAGVSIDQMIARQVGHLTRLPSLELTSDRVRRSAGCDSGYACAYQYNISWSSATTPMTPENNPRLVFERLFGSGAPGERTLNMKRRQQEQRSVLDFVLEDAKRMHGRLQARDKDKLDQYLTSVRDIETRIQRAEQFGSAQDPGLATPEGIPANEAEYMQLMYDMLILAFQTDSTRVATLLLGHDGENGRSYSEIGIAEGHHDLTHHQGDKERMDKVAQIDRWYVEQFDLFLKKLDDVKDVDGHSLLHNSMIVYGSGNADGNMHTHSNLPLVLAGAGGGLLKPGRYVKHGSKPMSNLFLSLADHMGVQGIESFGDATERLSDV
jgi:hypothetical protein